MNLKPLFIGGGDSGIGAFALNALIIEEQNTTITNDIELSISNAVIQTDLNINVVNETTNILVEEAVNQSADVAVSITQEVSIFNADTDSADVVSINQEASISNIDIDYSIPIEMSVGDGFPVYIGDISVVDSSLESMNIESTVTKEATAYLIGDVNPVSDTNIDITVENSIEETDGTLTVEADVVSTTASVSIDATRVLTDRGSVNLDITRIQETPISMTYEATIIAVDVLIDSTIVSSDQIVYEVADIDRGLQEGKLIIHPGKWSAGIVNIPIAKDGEMATVSNTLIPMIKEKYGDDIHSKISMIIARDPITGKELNYVITDGYISPSNSVNNFELCSVRENVFYPTPFIIKSVSNETLSVSWKAK